jgi:hypothetical protein
MNTPLALEMEHLTIGAPLGEHSGEAALPGILRGLRDFVLSGDLV